jgi:hypothetical protein
MTGRRREGRRTCATRGGRWIVLGLLLTVGLAPATAQTERADKLADLLDRLGLVELQVLHLQRTLQEELPDDQQLRLARRLGDLYAGQLIDGAEDKQRHAQILEKIQTLIRQVPQADTPALRVMLLQADYNQAEALAVRWISDPAQQQARSEALEILQRITPELNRFQEQLNARVDTLTDALADLPEGDQRDAVEQQFDRAQAVAGRATYFAGWANYYWGLVQGEDGQAPIRLAREVFRRLLDIRTEQYESIDAQWLGLESVWRSRALIGLGLSEAAIGQLENSRVCFALLEHSSVPPEMQDQASFWYLQGLLKAGQFDAAAQYADARVGAYRPPASQGKVSVCVALVRAAFGDQNHSSKDQRRRLGNLGIEGLARLGQQRTIEQLVEQYQIDLQDVGGFVVAWSAGRSMLAAAQRSQRPEDYRAAVERLEAALSAQDADRQWEDVARCRYELAWARLQLKDYEQAAQIAQMAWVGLKPTDRQTAAQAAWIVFASYQKLGEQQPRYLGKAIDVLHTLKRDFPNHPYAERANVFLDRLQRHTESADETIRRLEKVPPGTTAHLASLYDLCLLRHQQWAQADPAEQNRLASQVIQAARRYLDAAGPDQDGQRSVKCCLLAAEAALKDPADQGDAAAAMLDRASPSVTQLPDSSPLVAEYHYRRMQLAALRDDRQQRQQRAQWLIEHAADTAYELPALIVAARAAEQRLEQSSPAELAAARQAVYRIYQRLVTRLGTSVTTLQTDQNARVALSRSADYAMQLEQYHDAAGRWDLLLEAFPSDRNYLRNSGVSHFRANQYPLSLARWRLLLAGVPSGTDLWYEAKYHQILCLVETEPEMARKVLQQFQLLDPELGSPPWRGRFQALLRNFLK